MKTFFLRLVFALSVSVFTRSFAQTGLCPAPNGDFPNPSSELCTTFFRCFQGNPSLLRCPANQRFDFLFRMCRQQELVDCNSQLEVFATPALLSGNGGLGTQISPLVGNGGVGGLGTLGGLGEGFQNGGLFSLLSQLDDNNEGGQNGNNGLANLLMMSALMNQRSSTSHQEIAPGTVPLSQLYPIYNQPPLASLMEPQEEVTNQNYRMPRNIYDNQDQTSNHNYLMLQNMYDAGDAGFDPDTGAVIPQGTTFIFVPQGFQSQIGQSQGQGHVQPPWSQMDARIQRNNVGMDPDANQNYNAVQGHNVDVLPGSHGQNTLQDQNNFQGQNTIHGQNNYQDKNTNKGLNVDKFQVTNQGQTQGINQGTIQDQVRPGVSQGHNIFQGQNVGTLGGIHPNQGQTQGINQGTIQDQVRPGVSQGHNIFQGQNVGTLGGIHPGHNLNPGQNGVLQDSNHGQDTFQGQNVGVLSAKRPDQGQGQTLGVFQGINRGPDAIQDQNMGVSQVTSQGQNTAEGQESQASQGPLQGQGSQPGPSHNLFPGRGGQRGRRRGHRQRVQVPRQNLFTQLLANNGSDTVNTIGPFGQADLGRK